MVGYRCLLALWMFVRRVRLCAPLVIVALFTVACASEPMRAHAANDCDEALYVGGKPGHPLRLSSSKRLLSDKGVLPSGDEVPWFADSQQRTEARVQKYRIDKPASQCSADPARADGRVVLAIPDDLYARLSQAVEQTCKVSENERPDKRHFGQQFGSSPIRLMPPTTIGVEAWLRRAVDDAVRKGSPVWVPATPEPDPAPRAIDHPAAQAVGGGAAGLAISFVPGGSLAADAAIASDRVPQGTPWARAGRYTGEVAGGVGQIAIGCAGMAGGAGLMATGGGGPPGLVIIVGSVGVAANGVVTCVVAAPQAADAIADLLWRADDSQPATASTPPPAAPAASPPAASSPPPPPKVAAPPAAAKPPPSMAARPEQTTTTVRNKATGQTTTVTKSESGNATTTTVVKGKPPGAPTSGEGLKVNASQRTHILNGHGPGTTVSGKGAFPKTWTNGQAIDAVERVANSPKSIWVQSGGRPGATHYNNGAPMKYVVSGRDHGLDIEVIVEPGGRGIVTGYPTNVPRNP